MGSNSSAARIAGTPRHERFGWSAKDDEGQPMKLGKYLLKVDDTYQRTASRSRIAEIAKNFTWAAFGVISVSRRSNGLLYVFDGQHRVLAAKMRDDIDELPCIVFEFDGLSSEAQAFISANTVRGPVTAFDKFRARLEAHDADAIMIQAILAEYGLQICANATKRRGGLWCVESIERIYKRGADHLRRVLLIGTHVSEGQMPQGKILRAFSHLDQHLQRKHKSHITRPDIAEKLTSLGAAKLTRAITSMSEAMGQSGEKVWAAGIVNALNRHKRSKRIHPIFMD